jgi:hypothetical protein
VFVISPSYLTVPRFARREQRTRTRQVFLPPPVLLFFFCYGMIATAQDADPI